jgi:hypothetical protein
MVIAAFVAVRGRAVPGMRVRGGLVPIGVIVGMSVVFVPAGVLVMRKRHALGASNCRHALHRNGQGQQQHSKKAEERLRHQRAL